MCGVHQPQLHTPNSWHLMGFVENNFNLKMYPIPQTELMTSWRISVNLCLWYRAHFFVSALTESDLFRWPKCRILFQAKGCIVAADSCPVTHNLLLCTCMNSHIFPGLMLQQQYVETLRQNLKLKKKTAKMICIFFPHVATQKGTPDSTMQSTKMSERSGPWEAIGPLTAPISKWCYGAVDICQGKRAAHRRKRKKKLCSCVTEGDRARALICTCVRGWSLTWLWWSSLAFSASITAIQQDQVI